MVILARCHAVTAFGFFLHWKMLSTLTRGSFEHSCAFAMSYHFCILALCNCATKNRLAPNRPNAVYKMTTRKLSEPGSMKLSLPIKHLLTLRKPQANASPSIETLHAVFTPTLRVATRHKAQDGWLVLAVGLDPDV